MELGEKRVNIPIGKVAKFVSSLILKARNGFTRSEAEEILVEFVELLADVLKENVSR